MLSLLSAARLEIPKRSPSTAPVIGPRLHQRRAVRDEGELLHQLLELLGRLPVVARPESSSRHYLSGAAVRSCAERADLWSLVSPRSVFTPIAGRPIGGRPTPRSRNEAVPVSLSIGLPNLVQHCLSRKAMLHKVRVVEPTDRESIREFQRELIRVLPNYAKQ